MPEQRKKPFSGKAKKQQLKERRARKSGKAGKQTDSKESRLPHASVGGQDLALRASLGKSGVENRWSTVVVRESDSAVAKRKERANLPLYTGKRGSSFASDTLSSHEVVFPTPVRAHADLKGLSPVEANRRAFMAWLDGIYQQYRPEQLNSFEHNPQVWSQLWHVLEHCTAVCMVVDGRHPQLHLSRRLYEHVTTELRKPFIIVMTKVDLIPKSLSNDWEACLRTEFPRASIVQFSSAGKHVEPAASLAARRRHIEDARKSYSEFHLKARWECCQRLLTAAGVASPEVLAAAEGLVMSARGGGRGAASGSSGTAAKRAMLMERYGSHAVSAAREQARAMQDAVDPEEGAFDLPGVAVGGGRRGGLPVFEDSSSDSDGGTGRRRGRKGMRKRKGKGKGTGKRKVSEGVGAVAASRGAEGADGAEPQAADEGKVEAAPSVGGADAAPSSGIPPAAVGDGDQGVRPEVEAPPAFPEVILGMVGEPNQGKSSIVNTLAGAKRVSVSRTAGHTKRAQTVELVPGLKILDCPGMLFPHAYGGPASDAVAGGGGSSEGAGAGGAAAEAGDPKASRAGEEAAATAAGDGPEEDDDKGEGEGASEGGLEAGGVAAGLPLPPEAVMVQMERERALQEVSGIVPLAQVREPYTAVRYLAERLPLESMYGLALPEWESQWTPLAICEALAEKQGVFIARTGRPDGHTAGRTILFEATDGVLPFALATNLHGGEEMREPEDELAGSESAASGGGSAGAAAVNPGGEMAVE